MLLCPSLNGLFGILLLQYEKIFYSDHRALLQGKRESPGIAANRGIYVDQCEVNVSFGGRFWRAGITKGNKWAEILN
jgi:hypothetical protein